MPSFNEFTFLSSNGKNNVFVRECVPDGEIRGVVQIAHGLAEHCTRYDGLAAFLAEHDYLAVSNDHIGHGRSVAAPEDAGFLSGRSGWDKAVEDLRRLRVMTGAQYPDVPYVLFGHSMGSFLARTYLIRSGHDLDGCILSGTCQPPRHTLTAAALLIEQDIRRHGTHWRSRKLMQTALGMRSNTVGTAHTICDWVSSDPEAVDEYLADPLCGTTPTAGLLRDMVGGMRFNAQPSNLRRMDPALPVLFLSGEQDLIGGCGRGVIRAYRSFLNAGMTDVTLKLYPDSMHELLHDRCCGKVLQDILRWLESKA